LTRRAAGPRPAGVRPPSRRVGRHPATARMWASLLPRLISCPGQVDQARFPGSGGRRHELQRHAHADLDAVAHTTPRWVDGHYGAYPVRTDGQAVDVPFSVAPRDPTVLGRGLCGNLGRQRGDDPEPASTPYAAHLVEQPVGPPRTRGAAVADAGAHPRRVVRG